MSTSRIKNNPTKRTNTFKSPAMTPIARISSASRETKRDAIIEAVSGYGKMSLFRSAVRHQESQPPSHLVSRSFDLAQRHGVAGFVVLHPGHVLANQKNAPAAGTFQIL